MPGPLISNCSILTSSSARGREDIPLVARLNFAVECSLAHSMYKDRASARTVLMLVRSSSKGNRLELPKPELPTQRVCLEDSGKWHYQPLPSMRDRKDRW